MKLKDQKENGEKLNIIFSAQPLRFHTFYYKILWNVPDVFHTNTTTKFGCIPFPVFLAGTEMLFIHLSAGYPFMHHFIFKIIRMTLLHSFLKSFVLVEWKKSSVAGKWIWFISMVYGSVFRIIRATTRNS